MSSDSVLVDKRLGNSYETVKAVAESLSAILFVAANLQNLTPRDIELQVTDTFIFQWRYAGVATWTDLVDLNLLNQGLLASLASLQARVVALEAK